MLRDYCHLTKSVSFRFAILLADAIPLEPINHEKRSDESVWVAWCLSQGIG